MEFYREKLKFFVIKILTIILITTSLYDKNIIIKLQILLKFIQIFM